MRYYILFHIFMIILSGCELKKIMKPNPTGVDRLDVYVNDVLKSQNLVVCEKIVDVEHHLNHMICDETETNRSYSIPFSEWEHQYLEDYFSRVSKEQLKNFIDHWKIFKNNVCSVKKEIVCGDDVHYEAMEQLIPYLEVKDEI